MKKNASPLKETYSNAGLPSADHRSLYNVYSKPKKPLGIDVAISKNELRLPTAKLATAGEKKLPTAENRSSHKIYFPKKIPLGIDVVISESELKLPTAVESDPLKNFWSNLALGSRNPLKGKLDSRISTPVLAKRLGYPLCQIFELIEAGSIICRNGLIPDEEAERLLHPKIEIKE